MKPPPLWPLGLVVPLLVAPWLAPVDAQLRTFLFQLRGERPRLAPDPLVLAIDSDSLTLAERLSPAERQASPLRRRMAAWPWPRALQADLAALALERGAALVVFNIVHDRPSRFGPEDDTAFRRRLMPWRQRVVLAGAYEQEGQVGVLQVRLRRPLEPFTAWGLTALLQDPQGRAQAIPGRHWTDRALAGFPPPRPLPLAYLAAGRPVPAHPLGLDHGWAGRVRVIPAWRAEQVPAATWRDRIVLLGATAAELGDRQETPFGSLSGTEVQAMALATLREGSGFVPLPLPLAGAALLLWGGAVALLLGRCRGAGRSAATTLLLGMAGLACGGILWWWGHRFAPLVPVAAMPLAAGLLRTRGLWVRENRERAWLHQVLARRISPALLEDLLRQPGPLGTRLGGSRARCVVLFTDLVAFTALSARLDPEDLFGLLNRYFAAVAAAVLEEQGLLDKFIGDALMAEFGVPRSRGDAEEAMAAVRAALAIHRRLQELNRELAQRGEEQLRQGIGLHFGEVMAGNLGSPERLEYTVIGATVNVASRLEKLTRRFPDHPILISGAVLALLPDRLDVLPLGHQDLAGVPEPLEVYALKGLLPPPADPSVGTASNG